LPSDFPTGDMSRLPLPASGPVVGSAGGTPPYKGPGGEVSLRDRLREALGVRPAPERPRPPAPGPRPPDSDLNDAHHYLPGFWQDTPAGRVFVIERRFELEHRHGRLALGRLLQTPTELWARIGREPALAGVDPRRVAFVDTETTGLAGGTGTLAFLVGMGHFLDGHFRLRQYFLADLGQERAMLRALADYLDGFEAVVTFNGKTFDLPLLETRLLLSRMRPSLTALPHLDLLHPARRLYRDRLESCRLGQLEQSLLGLVRVEDVPGYEIPSLFFRYMRTRRFRALLPVFEHNALDVLSLVTLTVHLAQLFGGDTRLTASDRLALGRTCEAEARYDEAIAHYDAALRLDLRPADREECERRLSLLYKKLGRWEEAVGLWQAIAERPANRALYPLLELAKYRERVDRDFTGARLMTERALLLLEGHHARMGYAGAAAERDGLHKRRIRLEEREVRARAAALRRPARRTAHRSEQATDS
jgi:uncharacterized protein YprB with RNaseH-like and TPR domain